MDFQVLGPVAAVRDDRPVTIGGARQLRILAALLNDANQVVPVSRLIEVVWRQRPSTVRTQVQIAVSRLRRSLEQPGEVPMISTMPPGYLMRLERGQLDSAVFQARVRSGQALAASGAVDDAASSLSSALRMWRGPALAGVRDSPVLEGWAASLEQTRLAALDLCFQVSLRAGQHARIIADLVQAAEEHPMHEGIQGSLMQALYLSQRQADALGVYQKTRRRLIETLGVEPGRQLRRLEYEILSGAAEEWAGRLPDLNEAS